jgi:hypothetical protein
MRKLLVAAVVVLMTSPAFAAIQNVKVSGDITTTFVDRNNFDLGLNNGAEYAYTGGDVGTSGTLGYQPIGLKKQNVFITQTRLRVDADLSDNVSTTVGLINERAWNAENGTNGNLDTNVQLYLASVTLREFLYSPLTLQIGRQVFNYGNGLILGDGGAINSAAGNLAGIYADLTERTAYDGVTATLDYKPLTVSLIYFKNGQNNLSGLGHLTSGQSSDVYGYNANYQLGDAYNTVIEQYLFTRINGSGFQNLGAGADKGNTLYVPGLRASTNPIKGLNVQGEIAWQLGNNEIGSGPVVNNNATAPFEGEHRSAMAAQLLASYSLPVLEKYKPTVNASYTYASGDKNGSTNYPGSPVKSAKTYTGWDEFNTIQGAGTIYRDLFNFTNEHIVSVGASVAPLEDVTAGVTWSGIWNAAAYGTQNTLTLLQPNGSTGVAPALNNKGYWLGNETDVNLTYNYTEDVTFGVSLGWFAPGSAFQAVSAGDGVLSNKTTASQAMANVAVKF